MLSRDVRHQDRLAGIEEKLRRAQALTPDLMTEVVAQASVRLAALGPEPADRIRSLLACGGTIDAVLALITIERPRWSLRRLVCDDGEWLCSLSQRPSVPLEFDDLAEASHPSMALALLLAFIAALRAAPANERTTSPIARPRPTPRPTLGHPICCDNFA